MTDTQDWLVGGGIAFLVALITTPAGVSGAVLLLEVQISVLHVPNPTRLFGSAPAVGASALHGDLRRDRALRSESPVGCFEVAVQ